MNDYNNYYYYNYRYVNTSIIHELIFMIVV